MSDWKEIGTESSSTWDMEKPLIGKFVNTRDNVGPNGSLMHYVQTEDGLVGAWGSTVLDNKLSNVQKGQDVKISYLGLVKNPKTNRSYKDFSVMVKEYIGEDITDKIDLADIPFGE